MARNHWRHREVLLRCHGARTQGRRASRYDHLELSRRRDTDFVSLADGYDLASDPEDEHALTLLAKADGVSKQEAMVRAIHEAASRRLRKDKMRNLSAGARKRYDNLLDRLGK